MLYMVLNSLTAQTNTALLNAFRLGCTVSVIYSVTVFFLNNFNLCLDIKTKEFGPV